MKPKCTNSCDSDIAVSSCETWHVSCRFILSSIRSNIVICPLKMWFRPMHFGESGDAVRWLIWLTSKSQPYSLGFTLHIIFTTRRDSISIGSGVTDFTDSAVSGDMALDRHGGGCFGAYAVNGYTPYLSGTFEQRIYNYQLEFRMDLMWIADRFSTHLTSSTSFSNFSADGTSDNLNSIRPDIRWISANTVFDL